MKYLAAALVVLVLAGGAVAIRRADAQGPNRAGIVVSFDNTIRSACIDFDEAGISGAELLRRAGFDVVAAGGGMGSAVCMIDGVGCADPNDCWCECKGSTCRYWAYFTLEEGNWKYSPIGASQREVRSGDVDGWTWGQGTAGSASPPDATTFDEVCPPEHPPPTIAPPPPALTVPAVVRTEPAVEAAAPTAETAPGTTIVPQPPTSTVTAVAATRTPVQTRTAEVADATRESDSSSFPWQLPAFGALAAVLIGSAVVAARRRQHG